MQTRHYSFIGPCLRDLIDGRINQQPTSYRALPPSTVCSLDLEMKSKGLLVNRNRDWVLLYGISRFDAGLGSNPKQSVKRYQPKISVAMYLESRYKNISSICRTSVSTG